MRTTCGARATTCLSGKMHFVGPDQMHGFEERLTTDIYPADFGWTPDYRKPGERIDWWYHNLGSVTGAGVAEITNQMEYDDEVAFFATQKLQALTTSDNGHDARPWALTVSFTHPHDPYVARKQYWDLYEDCEGLAPRVPPIPYDQMDQHSQRLYKANDSAQLRHHRRQCAALAAGLFRQHLLSRRQDRRDSGDARSHPDGRQHHHRLLCPTMATCWASAACGSR
jgi:choline-sulfatase